MNRYIFKNMIKPVALVTSVGIAMQVPFNVWASKTYEEQLQQIAEANGDVGRLLDNIPGLTKLKDEGILEKSEENKYIAVSVGAASVNEVDSVYKLMKQVNSGNLSNIDVADITKKNSEAYSKVEKLKNVVVDIAVNTVLKEANLEAENDINTKPNEDIVTVMKLAMEESKNLHHVANDIVVNAGKKKTPQNSFIGGKVENLVSKTADLMRSSRGGGNLSQEDLQGIRGAVEDLNKGVEIKRVADEMVNRNANVVVDAAVTEAASNQVAIAIEKSGVDSQNVEAMQNIDVVKSSVQAIAGTIGKTDNVANTTVEALNKQLEDLRLELQQALEKNKHLASELKAQKEENKSKTQTIEELNKQLKDALQGKTEADIAKLLEESNELTTAVGEIRKRILAMDYTESAKKVSKEDLKDLKTANENAQEALKAVKSKATSESIKDKKDYAEKLVKAKKAEQELLEEQKKFNQDVRDAIQKDFREKINKLYKEYDLQVRDALIKELESEIINLNVEMVEEYDAEVLKKEVRLKAELKDARKKLADCELLINQTDILERLDQGKASEKEKEKLLELQTENLKTDQPTVENATIKTAENYKTYADKNLQYQRQKLKNNPDNNEAKTGYLQASKDVEKAKILAKVAILNEEKKYIAGGSGFQATATEKEVKGLRSWLKDVRNTFMTVLGVDKDTIFEIINNDERYENLFKKTYKDKNIKETKLSADNTDVLQFGKSVVSLQKALEVREKTAANELDQTYTYNGNVIKPIAKEIQDLQKEIDIIDAKQVNIIKIKYDKDTLYTNIIKNLDGFLGTKTAFVKKRQEQGPEYKNVGTVSAYKWWNGKINANSNAAFQNMVFYILLLKDLKNDKGENAGESYEQFINNVLANKEGKYYKSMQDIVKEIKKANGYKKDENDKIEDENRIIKDEDAFIKSIFNSFKQYINTVESVQKDKIVTQKNLDKEIDQGKEDPIGEIKEVKVDTPTFDSESPDSSGASTGQSGGTIPPPPSLPGGTIPPPPSLPEQLTSSQQSGGATDAISEKVTKTIGYQLIEDIRNLQKNKINEELQKTEPDKTLQPSLSQRMKNNLVKLLEDKNAAKKEALTSISIYLDNDGNVKKDVKLKIDKLTTEDKQEEANKLIEKLKGYRDTIQESLAGGNDVDAGTIKDVNGTISELKELLHNEQDDLEKLEKEINNYFSLSKDRQEAKKAKIEADLDSLENSTSNGDTKAKIKELRDKLNLASQQSNTLEDLKKIYEGDDQWLTDKDQVMEKRQDFVAKFKLTPQQKMLLNNKGVEASKDEFEQLESVIGEENVKIIKAYDQLYEYLDKVSNIVDKFDQQRYYKQIHQYIVENIELLQKQSPEPHNQGDQDDQGGQGDQDDRGDRDDQDNDVNPKLGGSGNLATDKELSALLEGSNTMSEEQLYECLYNIVLAWLIEGSINCVQVGDQVAYKEIVNMVSKAKQVFTSGQKDDIENVVLFALKTRLKYIEKYTPYYTASGLLAKYFSADGTVKQGVDENADVLKKVAIVDFLYAQYSLDSSFNIANISNVDNVVKIIQSLQTTLYTNKCVPTNDFFDSIIYKDVEKKQVNTECIGNLNLVAAAMVFSDRSKSDGSKVEGKSGLNKVMNTLISYPVYDPDASLQNDWRKSCEQVLLELGIGS